MDFFCPSKNLMLCIGASIAELCSPDSTQTTYCKLQLPFATGSCVMDPPLLQAAEPVADRRPLCGQQALRAHPRPTPALHRLPGHLLPRSRHHLGPHPDQPRLRAQALAGARQLHPAAAPARLPAAAGPLGTQVPEAGGEPRLQGRLQVGVAAWLPCCCWWCLWVCLLSHVSMSLSQRFQTFSIALLRRREGMVGRKNGTAG